MLKDSKRSRPRLRSEYFPFLRQAFCGLFLACLLVEVGAQYPLPRGCFADKMKDQEESKSEIIVNSGLLGSLPPCGQQLTSSRLTVYSGEPSSMALERTPGPDAVAGGPPRMGAEAVGEGRCLPEARVWSASQCYSWADPSAVCVEEGLPPSQRMGLYLLCSNSSSER